MMVLTMGLREVGLLVNGAAGQGRSRGGPMGPPAMVRVSLGETLRNCQHRYTQMHKLTLKTLVHQWHQFSSWFKAQNESRNHLIQEQ